MRVIFGTRIFPIMKCTSTNSKLTTLTYCMHTSLTFPSFSRVHLWIQKSFALRGVRLWGKSKWIFRSAFIWTFSTRRMKIPSRPDGFISYGKLGVVFFSTSELVYPNMKVRWRLITARLNFYLFRDNPNVNLGIVDCSIYTRRIAMKDDYLNERMDMPANAPVEFNYLETLAKTFAIPARQNQFI